MSTTPYRPLDKENNVADSYSQLNNGIVVKNVAPFETLTNDSSRLNASMVVSYNSGGEVVKIEKTVGADIFTKNITPISGDTAIIDTVDVSPWNT